MPTRDEQVEELKSNLVHLSSYLKELLKNTTGVWQYDDMVYRFYHQSFKVFYIQSITKAIVAGLKDICPEGCKIDQWFLQIIDEGTGKEFVMHDTNSRWLEETRPLLEAYFHAKYMLEMAVKYIDNAADPEFGNGMIESGWASLLYLYGLRQILMDNSKPTSSDKNHNITYEALQESYKAAMEKAFNPPVLQKNWSVDSQYNYTIASTGTDASTSNVVLYSNKYSCSYCGADVSFAGAEKHMTYHKDYDELKKDFSELLELISSYLDSEKIDE